MTKTEERELTEMEAEKAPMIDPADVKTPEQFREFMRAELARYRKELGLTNPPGQNGVPMDLKKGERLLRARTRLPEAESLNEAMKKAGVSRKGRRAYIAAQKKTA